MTLLNNWNTEDANALALIEELDC